jgi:hypothetical protein
MLDRPVEITMSLLLVVGLPEDGSISLVFSSGGGVFINVEQSTVLGAVLIKKNIFLIKN